ncbi:MAG: hypothetical protein ABWX59_05470 [Microbacteriaceae bacterium]
MDLSELIQRTVEERRRAARPIVVGVSGYCGAGKFTPAAHADIRFPTFD